MEIELKLLLDPASRSIVESHPAFAAAEASSELRQEVTTYFDTRELELRRHGASLRVRRSGSRFIQTVKLDAGIAIGARGEWEWDVASAGVDRSKLGSVPKDAEIVERLADRVEPIFVTKIKRQVWRLELGRETLVEAVIDEGTVQAGPRQATICEVELELKQGSTVPLFELAIDLAGRAALRYGPLSKAERGYRLISNELPPKPGLGLPDFDRKITVGTAFPRLVSAALRELAAEIPGAADRDVEGVHRMRAAIRKLRTLLVLFAPYLDSAASERFNATLRDLGRVLGESRDWDVFLTETLPRAEADGEAWLNLLREPAEARSAAAHAAVTDAVGSQRLTELILGLGAWLAESGWLRDAEPAAALHDLLPELLTRLERRVRKRAKHVDGGAVEDLHELRKALKKLRYSVEDVGPLFKRKAVHSYVRSIKAVLGVLGTINDAAVAVKRVGDVAPPDRPDRAAAAASLLRWNARHSAKALQKLDGKLERFFKAEPFWM